MAMITPLPDDSAQKKNNELTESQIDIMQKQLGLLQSQLENQNTQINNAQSTSNTSKNLSFTALLFSFGILALNSYNTFCKENPIKSQLKESITNQEKILELQKTYAKTLYEMDSTLLEKINNDISKKKVKDESKTKKKNKNCM